MVSLDHFLESSEDLDSAQAGRTCSSDGNSRLSCSCQSPGLQSALCLVSDVAASTVLPHGIHLLIPGQHKSANTPLGSVEPGGKAHTGQQL